MPVAVKPPPAAVSAVADGGGRPSAAGRKRQLGLRPGRARVGRDGGERTALARRRDLGADRRHHAAVGGHVVEGGAGRARGQRQRHQRPRPAGARHPGGRARPDRADRDEPATGRADGVHRPVPGPVERPRPGVGRATPAREARRVPGRRDRARAGRRLADDHVPARARRDRGGDDPAGAVERGQAARGRPGPAVRRADHGRAQGGGTGCHGRGAADGEPAGRAVRHPGELPGARSAGRGRRQRGPAPGGAAVRRDPQRAAAVRAARRRPRSAPSAAIADTSHRTPPPPKSAAADRAGGNPAASAEGAAVPPPLFAPRTTTPATPTAIAATSGTARLVSQLRARIAARVSLASRAGRPGPAGGSASGGAAATLRRGPPRRPRPARRAAAAATAGSPAGGPRPRLTGRPTAADHGTWPAGSARHVEFVARHLAELTQPVVHLSLSVRFAAAVADCKCPRPWPHIARPAGRALRVTDNTTPTRSRGGHPATRPRNRQVT